MTISTELAERVATACRVLGCLNATHEALGHVSVRDGSSMLIKGKGPGERGVRFTKLSDIVRVSFDVTLLEGEEGLRPPSESFLHAWIYKLNPDVQAIAHMHPRKAVLLTVVGRSVEPIYGAYGRGSIIAVQGLPTYDSCLRVNDNIRGEAFARFLGAKRAVLMRGHGMTAVGSSIEECVVATMRVVELTEMYYDACLIGVPRVVTPEEAMEIADMDKPGRALGSASGATGIMAAWRYYRSLADESSNAKIIPR